MNSNNYRVVILINDVSRGGGAQRIVSTMCKDQHVEYQVYVLKQDADGYDIGAKSIFSIRFVFDLFRADFVQVHLFPMQYLFCWLGFFKKTICFEHNTVNRRRRPLYRTVERWVYKKYTTLVGCSEAMSASLESWVNLPVTTVTNCYDNHIFIAQPKDLADRLERWGKWFNCEGPLVVVMVGSFTEQKDQKGLINLIGIMPTLRLKLVGEGPTKSEAQDLVKDLDIANRVEFLGLVANPELVLAESDLMIHLAHWEGFGLAALEAQAVGVPVLCSDVAGLRDLVCERALLQSNSEELLTSKIDALTPSVVTDLIDWGLENSKEYTVEKYNNAIRISLYDA